MLRLRGTSMIRPTQVGAGMNDHVTTAIMPSRCTTIFSIYLAITNRDGDNAYVWETSLRTQNHTSGVMGGHLDVKSCWGQAGSCACASHCPDHGQRGEEQGGQVYHYHWLSFLCFSTQSEPSLLTSNVLAAGEPTSGKRSNGFPFILYLAFKCVIPFVLFLDPQRYRTIVMPGILKNHQNLLLLGSNKFLFFK